MLSVTSQTIKQYTINMKNDDHVILAIEATGGKSGIISIRCGGVSCSTALSGGVNPLDFFCSLSNEYLMGLLIKEKHLKEFDPTAFSDGVYKALSGSYPHKPTQLQEYLEEFWDEHSYFIQELTKASDSFAWLRTCAPSIPVAEAWKLSELTCLTAEARLISEHAIPAIKKAYDLGFITN